MVKRHRKFRGFPQPYSDETFSSWLFRGANSKGCDLSIESVEYYIKNSLRNGVDYDFSFGAGFKRLCSYLGLDYSYCKKYFAINNINMVLSVYERNSFCRQCLDEDVKYRAMPYWRRSWCRFDVAYCSLHKTLLATTQGNYGVYRSWESFAFFPNFLYEPKGRNNIFEFTTLRLLGFRVQNWLSKNRVAIESSLSAGSLISNLLSSFLSLRTEDRYCGIARMAFDHTSRVPITHKNYHYSLCMYYGARTSSPTHRKAALIVLGVVFGFYSEHELQRLKKAAIYSYSIFPTSAAEVGSEVLAVLNEKEIKWYVSQYINISQIADLDISSRVEELLSNIKKVEMYR